MAKNIAFSTSANFLGARPKAERNASITARATDWLRALRASRNDSQIERYINEHGGMLTDSLEREITRKFANPEPGRY